jgi:hypothetical protein
MRILLLLDVATIEDTSHITLSMIINEDKSYISYINIWGSVQHQDRLYREHYPWNHTEDLLIKDSINWTSVHEKQYNWQYNTACHTTITRSFMWIYVYFVMSHKPEVTATYDIWSVITNTLFRLHSHILTTAYILSNFYWAQHISIDIWTVSHFLPSVFLWPGVFSNSS